MRQIGHDVLRSKDTHPRGARHDGAQRLVPRIRESTESTATDTTIHGEQQQSVSQQLPGAAVTTSCHQLSAAAKHKLPGSRTAQQLSAPGAGARATTKQLPTAAAAKLRSDPTTAAAPDPAKLSSPSGGAQQLRSSLFDACLRNAHATTDHHHNDNGPHPRLLEIRVRRERDESYVPQNVPRTHFGRAA